MQAQRVFFRYRTRLKVMKSIIKMKLVFFLSIEDENYPIVGIVPLPVHVMTTIRNTRCSTFFMSYPTSVKYKTSTKQSYNESKINTNMLSNFFILNHKFVKGQKKLRSDTMLTVILWPLITNVTQKVWRWFEKVNFRLKGTNLKCYKADVFRGSYLEPIRTVD